MILLLPLLLTASLGWAADPDPASFAGKPEMNGYRLKDYPDFQKSWKLVTVRFRKDTGELRFTYANPLAWKTLLAGKKEFPDGAIFAKIGFATQDDPAFLSSAVPSGARRYQLMVRNKKRHAATDGWGYALFDQKGVTFPENPKVQEVACAACHRLVPDRGYVFSEKLDFSPMIGPATARLAEKKVRSELKFVTVKLSELPASLQSLFPEGTGEIRRVEGELSDHLFQGTLDEIRPALAAEAAEAGIPAALFSRDASRYSITFRNTSSTFCAKSEELDMTSLISVLIPGNGTRHQKLNFCFGVKQQ